MRHADGGSCGRGGAEQLEFNTKYYMSENLKKYYQYTYLWAFLACIALLPMSGTIALRNILLVFMLILLIWGNVFVSELRVETLFALKNIPAPLMLWIIYLFLFPLWAPLPDIAWDNLRGQWGESIVAWVVGLGALVAIGNRRPGIGVLAMASAFPLMVHLFLSLLAYIGLFSDNFYQVIANRSLDGLGFEIMRWFQKGFIPLNPHHPLDEGFKGIEVMHGNLGYTSSVAISLLAAKLFGSAKKYSIRTTLPCVVAIGACFLSLLIARSRGAMLFNAAILCAGIIWNFARSSTQENYAISHFKNILMSRSRSGVGIFILLMLLVVGTLGLRTDARWQGMGDRIAAGFLIADPLTTLCSGLSERDEARIRVRLSDRPPAYIDEVVNSVRDGDGGRVVLMRAGSILMLENPAGLDGSRQSYERLMKKKCRGTPVLNYSHSHNSWFDLSLALGYVGVVLFAATFMTFVIVAVKRASTANEVEISMALGMLALFWFFRGFFDSLYREHYLEMQAIMLIYLYQLLIWRKSKNLD